MNHNTPPDYERKFADFIHLCRESKEQGVYDMVGYPMALGDTYAEIIESLSRVADSGLTLNIAARNPNPRKN